MHHENICLLIKMRSVYSPGIQLSGTWEKHISAVQHTFIQEQIISVFLFRINETKD